MALSPADLLGITFHSLRCNPVRSSLSMLGIFMGVAAVSATLQVGTISRTVIAEELANRDAPHVVLYPSWEPNKLFVPLKQQDLLFLQQRIPQAEAISAVDWMGTDTVLFQDQEATPRTRAVTQDFLDTTGRALLTGRFFTTADFDNYRSVAVIDQYLAEQLFPAAATEAVGQRIYRQGRPYIVVGVMQTKVDPGEQPDGEMLIPMSLHHALTGQQGIGAIQIRPQNLDDIDQVDQQAQQVLQQRFAERQFWTWNNIEDIRQRQQVFQMASRGLTAVGVISLLVGGVGIANIMIAAVTERTSEIGLRRAVGATRQEILIQFVLESAILSVMSGAIAIVVVHGGTRFVANTFDLPYQFEVRTATFALGAAVTVGIGASIVPAIQASKLDPVTALRSQ
jgi:putative ABC transport system permease protein